MLTRAHLASIKVAGFGTRAHLLGKLQFPRVAQLCPRLGPPLNRHIDDFINIGLSGLRYHTSDFRRHGPQRLVEIKVEQDLQVCFQHGQEQLDGDAPKQDP